MSAFLLYTAGPAHEALDHMVWSSGWLCQILWSMEPALRGVAGIENQVFLQFPAFWCSWRSIQWMLGKRFLVRDIGFIIISVVISSLQKIRLLQGFQTLRTKHYLKRLEQESGLDLNMPRPNYLYVYQCRTIPSTWACSTSTPRRLRRVGEVTLLNGIDSFRSRMFDGEIWSISELLWIYPLAPTKFMISCLPVDKWKKVNTKQRPVLWQYLRDWMSEWQQQNVVTSVMVKPEHIEMTRTATVFDLRFSSLRWP